MEHRVLGKSGLNVPVIGMGTWQTFDVQGTAAEQNARAVVDRELQAGASFFDSSPMYGEAERMPGETLRGRREQVMVATKVWASSGKEGEEQARRAPCTALQELIIAIAWLVGAVRTERRAGVTFAVARTGILSTVAVYDSDNHASCRQNNVME